MSTYARFVYACGLGIAMLAMPLNASQVTYTLGGTPCSTGAPSVQAGLCSESASHLIDFDAALGLGSPFVDGIATFTFEPSNPSPFVQGSEDGQYAAPGRLATAESKKQDLTPYLSVGSPQRAGRMTITFSAPISYYGFYLGSPDLYNVVDFFENAGDSTPVRSFTGHDLIPPAGGAQDVADYINFNITGGVRQIVMTSNQAAFETDNHAYAQETPEPGALYLGGLGCLMLAGRWMWRKAQPRA